MSILSPARWLVGYKLLQIGSRPVPHSGKIVVAFVLMILAATLILGGCGRLPTDPSEERGEKAALSAPKPPRTITWVPPIRVTPTPMAKPARTVTWAPIIRVTPS